MHFELPYFNGCPWWHQALENLRQALRAQGLALDVSLVRVVGTSHAKALRFRGSPTIRLSGEDLFPEQAGEYGLSCRVYQTEEGLKGWPTVPTVDMLRERLRVLSVFKIPIATGVAT